jgi:hypothetical protein
MQPGAVSSRRAFFALALLACGGPNPSAPAPTVDVSGTWTGTVTSTDGRGSPVFDVLTVTLFMSQNGRALSGIFRSAGPTGTVAGSVSANRVDFMVIVSGLNCPGQLSFTGSVRERPPDRPALDLSYEGTQACTGDQVGQGTLTME